MKLTPNQKGRRGITEKKGARLTGDLVPPPDVAAVLGGRAALTVIRKKMEEKKGVSGQSKVSLLLSGNTKGRALTFAIKVSVITERGEEKTTIKGYFIREGPRH